MALGLFCSHSGHEFGILPSSTSLYVYFGMTVDSQYNALLSLYTTVISDMKHSYGAWETVGQRAQKLSAALKTTATALQSFTDAVQAVSDIGNNLRGANRDVAACVTRVCMRERAMEVRLRAAADALSEDLAPTLNQRTTYWKARTSELEKANAKQIKKARTKGHNDAASISAHRGMCSRALSEQRHQFTFFIQALLPFFSTEVSWIEEATHVVPAVEGLINHIRQADPTKIVHDVLSDLIDVGEEKTALVLDECQQKQKIHRGGSEDPSPTWSAASDVASGSAESIDGPARFYAAPSEYGSHQRPLTRKSSHHSVLSKNSSMGEPPVAFRQIGELAKQRPQSFAGDLQQTNGTHAVWQPTTTSIAGTPYAANGFNGHSQGGFYNNPTTPSFPADTAKQGSSTSSDAASSALIAETLQQIDQLGHELDTLCSQHDAQMNGSTRPPPPAPPLQMQRPTHLPPPSAYNNTVRIRQSYDRSRPPPPERRGSQLSTGTPTASIARSSILGSRNSLNSSMTSAFDSSATAGANPLGHSKYTF
ncbi:unnamed protein product, partial [Mesorhabditis spiculigera]